MFRYIFARTSEQNISSKASLKDKHLQVNHFVNSPYVKLAGIIIFPLTSIGLEINN